jgi:hypothetical protein
VQDDIKVDLREKPFEVAELDSHDEVLEFHASAALPPGKEPPVPIV